VLPAAYAVGDKAAHGSSGYAGRRAAAAALLITDAPLHPCPCRRWVVVVMVAIRQIKTNSFYLAGARLPAPVPTEPLRALRGPPPRGTAQASKLPLACLRPARGYRVAGYPLARYTRAS